VLARGDDQAEELFALLRSLFPACDGFRFQGYIAGHAGASCILPGNLDGSGGNICTDNGNGDFSLGAVVVVDGFKKFGVEVGPVLEGEVFAENAGIDACGDECCLDEECSGAAHGVDKGCIALPSGFHDYACCENFAYGRFGLCAPVAAAVERLAG
jgi:hypothetical protein